MHHERPAAENADQQVNTYEELLLLISDPRGPEAVVSSLSKAI